MIKFLLIFPLVYLTMKMIIMKQIRIDVYLFLCCYMVQFINLLADITKQKAYKKP